MTALSHGERNFRARPHTGQPRRADARVDRGDVHGRREVPDGLGEDRGTAPDIAKRDQMCYVSNLCIYLARSGRRPRGRAATTASASP